MVNVLWRGYVPDCGLSYGEGNELGAIVLLVVGEEEAIERSEEAQDHH